MTPLLATVNTGIKDPNKNYTSITRREDTTIIWYLEICIYIMINRVKNNVGVGN